MKKFILASNNRNKLTELKNILLPLDIELLSQNDFNVSEVDEPYFTFVENALQKARHAAKVVNLPCIADDSGLCVDILDGAPGIFSARYAGEPKSDLRNIEKLLTIMEKFPDNNQRTAYFYCAIVVVRSADDPCPLIACGKWSGQISKQPSGNSGFGYDPIFYLPELNKTAAELSSEEKNKFSHRAIACNNLLQQLQQQF